MNDYIPKTENVIYRLAHACYSYLNIELTKQELEYYFTDHEEDLIYPLYDGDNCITAKFGIQFKHIHDFKKFNLVLDGDREMCKNIIEKVNIWANKHNIDLQINYKKEMEEL